MELSQRAAAALLRTRPSIFASALRTQHTPIFARAFTTTHTLAQDQPPTPTPSQPKDTKSDLDSKLDFLLDTPAVSNQRNSRFASPGAQQKNRVQPARPSTTQGTSINDIFNDFENLSSSRADVKGALNPRPKVADSPIVPLGIVPGPMLGRTVDVQGTDVARAFRSLDSQISRNRVKNDMFRQRFHERPGLKRKRLASERWRRRFKEAFKGTVKMVNKMRKQGW